MTGTSNLFKTPDVHMKHIWWCGFVSSPGNRRLFICGGEIAKIHMQVSLFFKKKKHVCHNYKAHAAGVAWGKCIPSPRKHFPSLKPFWVRALRFSAADAFCSWRCWCCWALFPGRCTERRCFAAACWAAAVLCWVSRERCSFARTAAWLPASPCRSTTI